MYRYDEFDEKFVRQRVVQFRSQVARRLSGALTEDEFKPLRLQNGLYLQLHAYMLRVAIPYGTLSCQQMRQLAMIAERWDKGYGHFTTRQNIQFNWPTLKDTPDILDALADVGMHAIQTSGNCIRNVTADHFAGACADEVADPRKTAELIRQWSTDHPEFLFLPRKFKIAVTGSHNDRAVTLAHDIGLRILRNSAGEIGYRVSIGGGLGRTPVVGTLVRPYLPKHQLLPYLESILRIYNLYGRRDNIYKARIKILVREVGAEVIKQQIEQDFTQRLEKKDGLGLQPSAAEVARIDDYFKPPAFEDLPETDPQLEQMRAQSADFRNWMDTNLAPHRQPGYSIVTISLKAHGATPGDASAVQMRTIADLAERFSFGEIRISHEQNVILPHVAQANLPALYQALCAQQLGTANVGLISDIIACPGMDYCALATARSIPIAQDIAKRFNNPAHERSIGKVKIKVSGCINACGHHHVGHIGILGLDKAGRENYQITLGGDHTESLQLGERMGPGVDAEQVVPTIERLMDTYLALRTDRQESFLAAYRRLGPEVFKQSMDPKSHN